MNLILDSVMLASVEDEDRFREVIDSLIKAKEVKKFRAYSSEDSGAKKSRKRVADLEAKEAEVVSLFISWLGTFPPFQNHTISNHQKIQNHISKFFRLAVTRVEF